MKEQDYFPFLDKVTIKHLKKKLSDMLDSIEIHPLELEVAIQALTSSESGYFFHVELSHFVNYINEELFAKFYDEDQGYYMARQFVHFYDIDNGNINDIAAWLIKQKIDSGLPSIPNDHQ